MASLAAVAILAGILSSTTPSAADHLLTPSNFNAGDGNQVVNGSERDWESFLPNTSTDNLFIGRETGTGSTDNSLAGGTKDDTECASTTTGSIPPNKDDLLRFYLYHETLPVGTAPNTDTFLYLGYVRALPGTTTASAHGVFELNKSDTKCSPTSDFYVRTPGDVRIAFDDEGGNEPVISVQRWQEPCPGNKGNDASGCWTAKEALDIHEADGAFNAGSIQDRLSANTDGAGSTGSTNLIGAQQFAEMKINMDAAGLLNSGGCTGFGAAGLFTGSSGNSDKEQSKDYIAPQPINLTFCSPATVAVNKSFTVVPTTDAVFTMYYDTDGSGTINTGDQSLGTCTVTSASVTDTDNDGDFEGTCSFTQLSFGSAPFTTFGPHTVIVTESTVPSGFNGSADQSVTFSFIVTAQSFTVNFTNSPAPGDVDFKKVDDASNPLTGAVFTLYDDVNTNGTYEAVTDTAVSPARTCTTIATGDCREDGVVGATHAFHNLPLGKYCVAETTTPTGYDTAAAQCFTISLGSSAGGGQTVTLNNFVDPRQHKIIVLVCHEGTNTLLGSTVTYEGGDSKTSLSSPPTGFTQAQLCALGGASYGNISGHAERDLTVTPGNH